MSCRHLLSMMCLGAKDLLVHVHARCLPAGWLAKLAALACVVHAPILEDAWTKRKVGDWLRCMHKGPMR